MTRGFALVELIVALVVLSAGLLALVGSSVAASRALTRAVELHDATSLAVATMDSLLAFAGQGEDSTRTAAGVVRWRVGEDGFTQVAVRSPSGSVTELWGGQVSREP